jgi:SAM-dependent methyltransferase
MPLCLSTRIIRKLRRLAEPALVGPIPRPPWSPPGNPRDRLARQFIRGQGLEIGALYNPLFVPPGVRVTYVDRFPLADLRAQLQAHPHLRDRPLAPVDLLADGETLPGIAPASQAFLIANHFLEHVQDPIGTLRRQLEILRPGGVLFLAVPDKRLTFDRRRPVTPLEHLFRDHFEGPAWSFRGHLREWAELVEGFAGQAVDRRADILAAEGSPSIHYHVWTQAALSEFLEAIRRELALPFDLEALTPNPPLGESIVVLRKNQAMQSVRRRRLTGAPMSE